MVIQQELPPDAHVRQNSKSIEPIRPQYFDDRVYGSAEKILLNNDSSQADVLSRIHNPYRFEIDDVDSLSQGDVV